MILLLMNGIGALYGGWNLMIYPDGSSLLLPLSYLEHSPFTDYFIPGMVLFIVNGIFSFGVLGTIVLKKTFAHRAIIIEGIVLFGWIILQVIFLQTINVLHYIFGSVGLGLVGAGWYLERKNILKRNNMKMEHTSMRAF